MKKYIISMMAVATVAIAGWNYQQNKERVKLSDLALENVEALASIEDRDESCIPWPDEQCRVAVATPGGNWTEVHDDFKNKFYY